MTDDPTMDGWHTALALEAVRRASGAFRASAHKLHDKQIRCGWPRPGGAARKFMETGSLPCGTTITIVKESTRDGGRIKFVLGRPGVTFTACNLRLLSTRLPETVATVAERRRLGDLVSLEGIMAGLHDEIVSGMYERDGHQVITLDMPSVEIRRSDIAAHVHGGTV